MGVFVETYGRFTATRIINASVFNHRALDGAHISCLEMIVARVKISHLLCALHRL